MESSSPVVAVDTSRSREAWVVVSEAISPAAVISPASSSTSPSTSEATVVVMSAPASPESFLSSIIEAWVLISMSLSPSPWEL